MTNSHRREAYGRRGSGSGRCRIAIVWLRSLGLAALVALPGCDAQDPDVGRSPAPEPETVAAVDTPAPAPAHPADDPAVLPTLPEWTAGTVREEREVTGVATLVEVRTGENQGFDRVVFAFEGSELPSYHVEYVDRPVRQCGSGDVMQVAGDGWLTVRLTPSRAHTEAGNPTIADRHRRLQMRTFRELRLICDFEAHVDWVIGVGSPNRFRVLELSDPARLVVDVRH